MSFAQNDPLLQDGFTRPPLSERCQELFKERNEKIKVQQNLSSLLQRNQNLLKRNPKANDSLVSRLRSNEVKIRNELYLAKLQIEAMEENIVRSGCPGLSL